MESLTLVSLRSSRISRSWCKPRGLGPTPNQTKISKISHDPLSSWHPTPPQTYPCRCSTNSKKNHSIGAVKKSSFFTYLNAKHFWFRDHLPSQFSQQIQVEFFRLTNSQTPLTMSCAHFIPLHKMNLFIVFLAPQKKSLQTLSTSLQVTKGRGKSLHGVHWHRR